MIPSQHIKKHEYIRNNLQNNAVNINEVQQPLDTSKYIEADNNSRNQPINKIYNNASIHESIV